MSLSQEVSVHVSVPHLITRTSYISGGAARGAHGSAVPAGTIAPPAGAHAGSVSSSFRGGCIVTDPTVTTPEPQPVLELCAGAPFDLLKSLTCLELLETHVDVERLGPASLRLPFDLGGRTVIYDLTQAGDEAKPALAARPAAGQGARGAPERAEVERQLQHLLGLADSPAGFYEIARQDSAFWRTAGTLEGLHRVGFATPIEGLCWTILRQRQYPNVARARLRRLRQRFGTPSGGHEAAPRAFPSAATLAGASLEAIRREVKSRKKARFLREAAVALAELGDGFDVLCDEPDALEERLLRIRGVGPWSVRTFLARACSRPHLGHVVIDGRVTPHWKDVLGRFYGPGIDPAFVRERADAYGPWEGYWLFYAHVAHVAMGRAREIGVVER